VTIKPLAPHEILDVDRGRIVDGLRQAVGDAGTLRSILRFHLGLRDEQGRPAEAGGKLLRSCLVLFVGRELGAPADRALRAAVALEMVHAFSLIHDDIQDGDRMRRGRPSVWARYGIAQAINAGDLLHAEAIRHALGASPAAAARLAAATVEMIEGQGRDVEYESRWVTPGEYLKMVDGKTGALLRCALELGGLAAGVDVEAQRSLSRIGAALGRAFQIVDDVLGLWGDDDVLGKSTGSDLRRRKKSLPVVLLWESADPEERAALERYYARDQLDASAVADVMSRLERHGVRARCEQMARGSLSDAAAAASALPFSADARARLQALAAGLARRTR
jgi:geranylgeranyl diphosphate synthase type I